MSKRLIITENEKKEILSRYGLISEQSEDLGSNSYNVQSNQRFTIYGQKLGGSPNEVFVLQNTKVTPNNDGKSVSFDVSYKENNQMKKTATKGKLSCGDYIIYVGQQSYQQTPDTGQPFKTKINQTFCSGNNLKTNKATVNKQPKTIKLNVQPNQICNLDYDKTWSYAKTKDGKWYASKDKVNWYDISANKTATNKLNVTDACKVIKELPAITVKPSTEQLPNLATKPAEQLPLGGQGDDSKSFTFTPTDDFETGADIFNKAKNKV